jgi:hypothetical protein
VLDFIVVALPRSGTTWAANWLTDDQALCIHDPLWTMHYRDLDEAIPPMAGDRMAGISCTALWRWPDWLNRHPAKKLILHRNLDEVRESMMAAGLPPVSDASSQSLAAIRGLHAPWRDLFRPERAQAMWQLLTGRPFDAVRHAELLQMEVSPRFSAVRRNLHLNAVLSREAARRRSFPNLQAQG